MEHGSGKNWRESAGQKVGVAVLCLAMSAMLFAKNIANSIAVSSTAKIGDGAGSAVEEKVAYLTFDDGPSVLTSEYLKILKEENVHATFFLIGQQVEGDLVDVVRQEMEEGHEIGLHTYCHDAGRIYSSKESYCEDLQKTKLCLEEKLHAKPKLFRFPWGSANVYVQNYKQGIIEEMRKQGIDYADWNVSGEDSVGRPSSYSILSNVRKDYGKYSEPVILLHDSATCRATLDSLRPIIQELKANGYAFRTLSERKNPCHFGE